MATIIAQVAKEAVVGVHTKDLDSLSEEMIRQFGGKPSFKGPVAEGFGGFPAAMCVSVNEEIVHGVPSERVLKTGDIVSLDLGIYYKGFHTDMAVTVGIGDIALEMQRMIRVTRKALKRGIKKARVGNRFGDIGNTVERYVENQGFNVVRELCGHGIGRGLHEDPQILNCGKRHSGPEIKPGMTFCIEPMVTQGDWHIIKAANSHTFVTKDKSMSAHFEHTIAATPAGPEILTRLENETEPAEEDGERDQESSIVSV